ncbi:MAG: PKD domain-containing protein, partial [Myxococcaceae bacterium]
VRSAPATITLEVGNGPPTVSISADTLTPKEGAVVRFTSTAKDPDGDSLTFNWSFGDDATSKDRNPRHTFLDEGTYRVELTVSDGKLSSKASLKVEVQNAEPIIVPFSAPAEADEGSTLTFSSSATDPGQQDTLVSYWDFGDGSDPMSGDTVQHAFQDNGRYLVTVTVTDDGGAFSTFSREVVIKNVAPVAGPIEAQSIPVGETLEVPLEGSDPAGDADPLNWTVVEGPGGISDGYYRWTPAEGSEGAFTVKLRVDDGDDGTAEIAFPVTVTADESVAVGCNATGAPTPTLLLPLGLGLELLRRARRRRR